MAVINLVHDNFLPLMGAKTADEHREVFAALHLRHTIHDLTTKTTWSGVRAGDTVVTDTGDLYTVIRKRARYTRDRFGDDRSVDLATDRGTITGYGVSSHATVRIIPRDA